MRGTSRREFLRLSGAFAGTGWLASRLPLLLAVGQAACVAHEKQAAFKNLEAPVAADLAAISAQIIPSGDTPGAAEAGVIYFIDEALGDFMKPALQSVLDGVESVNRLVRETGAQQRFAEIEWQQQKSILVAIDQDPFFSLIHFMTIAGMFAMPKHGGNRDRLGWQLLGFQDQHGWQPPFGYYDREQQG